MWMDSSSVVMPLRSCSKAFMTPGLDKEHLSMAVE